MYFDAVSGLAAGQMMSRGLICGTGTIFYFSSKVSTPASGPSLPHTHGALCTLSAKVNCPWREADRSSASGSKLEVDRRLSAVVSWRGQVQIYCKCS